MERGWKQREGHNFLRLRKRRGHEKWAVKKGGSCKYMPVMGKGSPTEDKGSSLFGKKEKKTRRTKHCGYKL